MRDRAERLRLLGEARIYAIGPARWRAGRLAELVPALARSGVGIVQLRDRELPPSRLEEEAAAVAVAAREAGILFIVNDEPGLAARVAADGVHLGQEDGAIATARALVGPDGIVGRTSRGGAMLATAEDEGADYASVSPVWETATKPDRPPVGVAAVAAAARTARIPWFPLGGVDRPRAQRLAAVGATRLAVLRGLVEAEDPAEVAAGLGSALDTCPRVLSIAGSDSGGAAGIQADIKAIVAAGGFPATAVTAVTAQSTVGVAAVHPLPAAMVAEQIAAVVGDLGVDGVKTGMLAARDVVEAAAAAIADLDPALAIPVVVDPVLRAESGSSLLDAAAADALRELLALAAVATPNLHEAQALARSSSDDAAELARILYALTGTAVIVTGGHGPSSDDVLCRDGAITRLEGERLPVPTTHGAGCTYASTLATLLAGGEELEPAAREAKRVATGAVRGGRAFGAGAGPVDVTRARVGR
jgi:hydroxymethylpyrimidine kinase/phosphomethylpyrimidine kinase/thiamine-phosphate diphosphorylase